jgi:integrator complex subunit 6
MIVVFVVDTSPSMGRPAAGDSGLSRLDVAKMAVEDIHRQWRKMRAEQQRLFLQDTPDKQRSAINLGQYDNTQDQFLLLSTSRQHPNTAACAAGGRLLIGWDANANVETRDTTQDPLAQHHQLMQTVEAFQRELKGLKAAKVDPDKPFPEDAGGAVGLNAALSAGLQLLSRYRLQHRQTENFGMGRYPCKSVSMPNGNPATFALQPACLILVRSKVLS